jgi:hypothetical protein
MKVIRRMELIPKKTLQLLAYDQGLQLMSPKEMIALSKVILNAMIKIKIAKVIAIVLLLMI